MTRFYFHLTQGEAIYRDLEGTRCANIERAVSRANDYARAIMREDPSVPRSSQCIEIMDDTSTVLRMVPFEIVPLAA